MARFIGNDEFRGKSGLGQKRWREFKKRKDFPPPCSELSSANKYLWLEEAADKFLTKIGRTKNAAA